ncbi:LCP family protein [Frigoribacterium sp. CFBP 8759]|uniref:LCP family glycopolymer transferase n=1 Tax=unclassified Frigoribacterium TaxID=2627005 RepID=UPI001565386F|nr:LCP family protein [Frigoribacterium sp. CFBP 8759]NQW87072.1 LCP family protein [Frigoribacterium sp. VKM Ac-2860]NQX08403.1 LCP family protein [Frigoribacterium sp. VKM Ac-2859]
MSDLRDRSGRGRRAARPEATASGRRSAPATTGVARHGRLKSGGAVRAVTKVVAASVAVLLVSGASVGAIAAYQVRSDLGDGVELQAAQGETTKPAPPSISEYEGGFNILVVGTDNDASQDQGAFGERDATLNDVNILLHVSADHTNATAVSIPRDMVVPIPSCAKEDGSGYYSAMSARPINEAYSYGGLSCVASTVSSLTGLDIPFAGMISFNGVIEMSNAIGGVPVCAATPIKDRYTGLDIPAGETVLSGADALAFLRTRHGVGDGSDLGRISSQQVYLSSLLRTVKSADTLSNPTKLYSLARAAASNMTLSDQLTKIDTMVQIGLALRDLPLDAVNFVQYPGTTGGSGVYENKVQPDEAVATQLFDAIANDVPFSIPEGSTGIGSENTGTGDGSAATQAPAAPAETAAPAQTAAPADTAAPTDPGAGAATTPPTTEVIEGLTGQTAADQTCSVAFGSN